MVNPKEAKRRDEEFKNKVEKKKILGSPKN
jgi:hypothetical protein